MPEARKRWIELWPGIDRMPWCSCVYVVLANDSTANCRQQAIYVGSTNNLRRRMFGHHIRRSGQGVRTPWGSFADVVIKIRPMASDWRTLERRLIERLRPAGNVQYLEWIGRSDRMVLTMNEETPSAMAR